MNLDLKICARDIWFSKIISIIKYLYKIRINLLKNGDYWIFFLKEKIKLFQRKNYTIKINEKKIFKA